MTTQHSRSFLFFLLLTSVLCGALVMVIQVLGSRVIGPFFGVSLFVWTSLITVTLVALAAGYAIGGHLADRHGSADWLYGLIIVAGIAVCLVPVLKAPVLKASLALGLRGGSLAGSAALFGVPLLLLGCVSPFLVRLVATEMRNLGRTVGGLYALSTMGSFLGTVGTGFFLIGYFGVQATLIATGMALISLGCAYFVFVRRRYALLLLLALPLLADAGGSTASKIMPDGTRVQLVASVDSFYGNIKVVDYIGSNFQTREMKIDGLVQGGIDTASGLSVYEYTYLVQFLPYVMNPDGRRCLVIGLGAGVVPHWYEERGIACDVVDIDPEVVELARSHFGYQGRGRVHVQDARYFLGTNTERYDFVILDVFNGDTTPGHLLSLEALRLVESAMAPGAVLALNLVGELGPGGGMLGSVVKTLRQVFDHIRVHPTHHAGHEGGAGNFVILAWDGPPRVPDLSLVRGFPVHPLAQAEVQRGLLKAIEVPDDPQAIVLTDDFNPIDFRDLAIKEDVRRQILVTTDWDILLD
ncbi:MAG TPA: fused MFS/spermidine synthase [Burkholderiales bacterium]|nr:fused MFS/spermidine synthase [Burkholderiales bacterium]